MWSVPDFRWMKIELAFIYENKTGALIAAACMCGAYLAGADDAVVAQLDEAAYAVGFGVSGAG